MRYGASSATVEKFALTFVPKTLKVIEPVEVITIEVTEPMTLASNGGVLNTYRQRTNFSGSMAEALKILGF